MIMILDTETTALRAGQIAQVGYILLGDGERTAKNFYFCVDAFDPAASAVNGLTVEKMTELSGGRRFCSDAAEILEDVERCGVLAAHNAHFDFCYLETEFARLGIAVKPPEFLDTMVEFTEICRLPRRDHAGYKYPKLGELTAFLGIGESEINTAARAFFGESGSYHDARFDAAAVYLALFRGRKMVKRIDDLLCGIEL